MEEPFFRSEAIVDCIFLFVSLLVLSVVRLLGKGSCSVVLRICCVHHQTVVTAFGNFAFNVFDCALSNKNSFIRCKGICG